MDYEAMPSPGGIISILLIFVFIVLGSRMAGAAPIEKTRGRRIATSIVLGLFVLIMGVLPFLSPFAFLIILFYGLFCGIVIMRRGNNRKRWLLGPLVIAWMGLAFADYATSLGFPLRSAAVNESSAVGTLRVLASAEEKFANLVDTKSSNGSAYGTFDDLRKRRLIDDDLDERKLRKGYLFGEVVPSSGKQFLFYAIPAHLPHSEPVWARFLPGCSLYYNGWRRDETHGTGFWSFAVDETGTIRFTSSPTSSSVTREQVAHWEKL
jgi:hypothetical protein